MGAYCAQTPFWLLNLDVDGQTITGKCLSALPLAFHSAVMKLNAVPARLMSKLPQCLRATQSLKLSFSTPFTKPAGVSIFLLNLSQVPIFLLNLSQVPTFLLNLSQVPIFLLNLSQVPTKSPQTFSPQNSPTHVVLPASFKPHPDANPPSTCNILTNQVNYLCYICGILAQGVRANRQC